VRSRCEPIALDQVLEDLTGVLREPRTIGEALEIGGGEVLSYENMLRQCATVMGKRLRILGVPVLTPRLSSYWLNLVTSVPMHIARPLVDGLRNDVITTDQRIRQWIPGAAGLPGNGRARARRGARRSPLPRAGPAPRPPTAAGPHQMARSWATSSGAWQTSHPPPCSRR
jgi:hypothetical protein